MIAASTAPPKSLAATLAPTAAMPRYGSLLVHVSTSQASEALTRSAVQIANLVGARVLGVVTGPRLGPEPSAPEREAAQILIEAACERFTELAAPARAGMAWRRSDGPPLKALVDHAWAADVLLIDGGDPPRGDPAHGGLRGLVSTSARPMLAVGGRDGEGLERGRTVVFWRGDKASARAVQNALPLLAKSREIVVVAEADGLDALRRGLALRGLEIDISAVSPAGAQRDRIAQLHDLDGDLVVMGLERDSLFGHLGRPKIEAFIADLDGSVMLSA